MDDTLDIIKRLVAEKGVLLVAAMLGHNDVQRINRWIKNDKIPEPQIPAIRAQLSQEGHL